MKNSKRTLGALLLTGIMAFGTLGIAPKPAKADGAKAAIIGAIVGYGLYKAGKSDGLDNRYRHDYRTDHHDYDRDRYDYDRGRYDDDCDDRGYRKNRGKKEKGGWRQGYRTGYRDSERDNRYDDYSYGGRDRRW